MIRVIRPVVLLSVLTLAGCSFHMDRATTLNSGVLHGSVYSVDGNVRVAPSAHVRKISVVDGDIVLGSWARTTGLRSVDGHIDLDKGVICTGNVKSVTGRIRVADGVRIEGDVRTLTGTIDANSTYIGGQLETVAGRVRLSGATRIAKGILLAMPDPSVTVNDHEEQRLPIIVIGPGVVVAGPIMAMRGGVLKVSRQAKIGAVHGISVQWFDGAAPALKEGLADAHVGSLTHQQRVVSPPR
ncbi:MAG: hypothetical protein ABI389_09110 [Rhodanobacter sp.]